MPLNRCKRTYFWEQKKWIGEWEKKTFELISLNLRSNRNSRDGALRGDWGTFQSTWNLWKCLSIALSLLMVFVWMETFFVGSVLFGSFFIWCRRKIADSDAQYSQCNHFGNCRHFGVSSSFLPLNLMFITHRHTRNILFCTLLQPI